jgi:hypothetical protein
MLGRSYHRRGIEGIVSAPGDNQRSVRLTLFGTTPLEVVMVRFIALLALALFIVGCGGNKNRYIRRLASQDLRCSESQVHLSTLSKSQAHFLAEACGRRAVYTYSRDERAVRVSQIEGMNVPGEPVVMTPPGMDASDVPPPPPPPPPPPRP